MSEAITITFKVKLQTEEVAELIRLLQSGSFEATLLADVADAVRNRLTGESRVVEVEMQAPQPDGGLDG
jgi:hypothetical protein